MARFVQLTAALGFLLGLSSSALACPFCDWLSLERRPGAVPHFDCRAVSYLLLACQSPSKTGSQ
jgi:hypothetical protein